MNKNLILSNNMAGNFASNFANSMSQMTNNIKQPIEWLRQYYSVILEKNLNMKQTALLLETQLAFVMMIFPSDLNLLLRTASLAWFSICLKRCKKFL